MQRIISHFDKYFEIVSANTPELLHECRKLRYQVLCIENNYLNIEEHKNACEMDEYDQRSAHSLILHKDSGIYAATVRLVLPSQKNIHDLFPMETHLPPPCKEEYNKLMHAPRIELGEVSRFMISKHFRQRVGETNALDGMGSDFGMLSPKMKRQFTAQISMGLFKAIVQMSSDNNIYYWLALMESRLIRLLARVGIHFNHLSDSIKYYGERHVCFETAHEILMGGRRQRPDIWEFVTNDGDIKLQKNVAEKRQRENPDLREIAQL
ncbi:MAG: PEP-CTERM/exosortase system-associated acyltransferase [Gammaproteobacteria bacterium]|nr:PEP-CTERM/exosortase system-associated acyltransferase [Gammaproteobacteria bacterium]